MMKRLLLAPLVVATALASAILRRAPNMLRVCIVWALVLQSLAATPLLAQAYGPDGAQPVTYKEITFPGGNYLELNRLGDGTTATGGTPPLVAFEPADVPTVANLSGDGWIVGSVNPADYPTAGDAKFRTGHGPGIKTGRYDAIRGLGQAISGHCHEFYGDAAISYDTTYASLRGAQTYGVSWSAGGPANLSAYWLPCPYKDNALGDGVRRVKRLNGVTTYYVVEAQNVGKSINIPWGFAFIGGTNMDDPDDTVAQAEVAAGNAYSLANGGYSNYVYRGNGWLGWVCEDTGYRSKYLANYDGSDALNDCPSTSQIYAEVIWPSCIDGHNIHSPSGYGHVRYELTLAFDQSQRICPYGWYKIQSVQAKIFFSHQGKDDYRTWRLDSDNAAAATAGHAFRNGESFHADWMDGWDRPTRTTFSRNCNGMEGYTQHECNYSVISGTQRLIVDSPAPDGSKSIQADSTQRFTGTLSNHWLDYPPTAAASGGSGRLKLRVLSSNDNPANDNEAEHFDLAALPGSQRTINLAP